MPKLKVFIDNHPIFRIRNSEGQAIGYLSIAVSGDPSQPTVYTPTVCMNGLVMRLDYINSLGNPHAALNQWIGLHLDCKLECLNRAASYLLDPIGPEVEEVVIRPDNWAPTINFTDHPADSITVITLSDPEEPTTGDDEPESLIALADAIVDTAERGNIDDSQLVARAEALQAKPVLDRLILELNAALATAVEARAALQPE